MAYCSANVAEGFITAELFEQLRESALAIFARGQEVAARQGLILVDTKYEFGIDENDELVLIDEVHTPDSSGFWQLASYEECLKKVMSRSISIKSSCVCGLRSTAIPTKKKLPDAPTELVEELSRRYIQIYEQITGEKFVCGAKPIGQRIEHNLKWYAI